MQAFTLGQAEHLNLNDEKAVPHLKRAIEQKENQISVLTGRNPGPITRGKSLLEQDLTVTIPPGLTSPLLERRPDIRFAEQTLVAANARIGEAKALLFPNIRITGASGWESAALKSLFTGPASFWDIVAPGLTQPIFNAGRLRAGVRAAEGVVVFRRATTNRSEGGGGIGPPGRRPQIGRRDGIVPRSQLRQIDPKRVTECPGRPKSGRDTRGGRLFESAGERILRLNGQIWSNGRGDQQEKQRSQ